MRVPSGPWESPRRPARKLAARAGSVLPHLQHCLSYHDSDDVSAGAYSCVGGLPYPPRPIASLVLGSCALVLRALSFPHFVTILRRQASKGVCAGYSNYPLSAQDRPCRNTASHTERYDAELGCRVSQSIANAALYACIMRHGGGASREAMPLSKVAARGLQMLTELHTVTYVPCNR